MSAAACLICGKMIDLGMRRDYLKRLLAKIVNSVFL